MTKQEENDVAEYCGFVYLLKVPRSVIDHLSRNGMQSFTEEQRESIVDFALHHLPLASAAPWRPYPL